MAAHRRLLGLMALALLAVGVPPAAAALLNAAKLDALKGLSSLAAAPPNPFAAPTGGPTPGSAPMPALQYNCQDCKLCGECVPCSMSKFLCAGGKQPSEVCQKCHKECQKCPQEPPNTLSAYAACAGCAQCGRCCDAQTSAKYGLARCLTCESCAMCRYCK